MGHDAPGGRPITLCVGPAEDFIAILDNLPSQTRISTDIRLLNGEHMMSTGALFSEFVANLEFPSYFGRNWDAFDECMADLEWVGADAYLVTVLDGGAVLRDEQDDLAVFVAIMVSVAEEWQTRGVPFHTLLQCAADDVDSVRQRIGVPVDAIAVSELKLFINTWRAATGMQSTA